MSGSSVETILNLAPTPVKEQSVVLNLGLNGLNKQYTMCTLMSFRSRQTLLPFATVMLAVSPFPMFVLS